MYRDKEIKSAVLGGSRTSSCVVLLQLVTIYALLQLPSPADRNTDTEIYGEEKVTSR